MKLFRTFALLGLGVMALGACTKRDAAVNAPDSTTTTTTTSDVSPTESASGYRDDAITDRNPSVDRRDQPAQAQEYMDQTTTDPMNDSNVPVGREEGFIDNTSSEPDADQL
jgi:hypothetical protein